MIFAAVTVFCQKSGKVQKTKTKIILLSSNNLKINDPSMWHVVHRSSEKHGQKVPSPMALIVIVLFILSRKTCIPYITCDFWYGP